jgi:hypothetical protein
MNESHLEADDAARIFAKLRIQSRRTQHQVAGFLVVGGRKVLNLHYGHSRDALGTYECERFRSLLRLSPDELARLRDCTMSRDDYIALLRQNGVIPTEAVSSMRAQVSSR